MALKGCFLVEHFFQKISKDFKKFCKNFQTIRKNDNTKWIFEHKKYLTNPIFNFCAFRRKKQFARNVRENFVKIATKYLKNIAKNAESHHKFPKNLSIRSILRVWSKNKVFEI